MTNESTTNNKLKVTVSLEVTLVTCVADFTAYSGQKLMILNNVCVGVLSEDDKVTAIKPVKPNGIDHEEKEYKRSFVTKPVEAAFSSTPNIKTKTLIDLVEKYEPITTMRIGDLLNIDRKSTKRISISWKCKSLARKGFIRDISPSRIGLYVSKDAKITPEMMKGVKFLNTTQEKAVYE